MRAPLIPDTLGFTGILNWIFIVAVGGCTGVFDVDKEFSGDILYLSVNNSTSDLFIYDLNNRESVEVNVERPVGGQVISAR